MVIPGSLSSNEDLQLALPDSRRKSAPLDERN